MTRGEGDQHLGGGLHGDMRSIFEGVLFECPNGSKFIKISEEMSFVALRKAVMDIVRGGRSLFEFFIANLYM